MLSYTVIGTDGAGNQFEVAGAVEGTNPLDAAAVNRIGAACFQQLTGGKAIYGKPGEGLCQGPYSIAVLTIELVPAEALAARG